MLGSTTYDYTFTGLRFEIMVTGTEGSSDFSAVIKVLEGSAEFNGLFWGDNTPDADNFVQWPGDPNINLKGLTYGGQKIDWDGGTFLSEPGLGNGDAFFLTSDPNDAFADTSVTIPLTGITSFSQLYYFGVRATSTSTEPNNGGSIKGVDIFTPPDNPPPPPPNHFPDRQQDISNIVLVFDVANGDSRDRNKDSYLTIKIDDWPGGTTDLDDKIDDILLYLFENGRIGETDDFLGAYIKGGKDLKSVFYADDENPDVDDAPGGIKVNFSKGGAITNADQSVDYDHIFPTVTTTADAFVFS